MAFRLLFREREVAVGGMRIKGARAGSFPRLSLVVAAALLTAAALGSAIQPGLAVNNPTLLITASGSTEVGLQIFANANLNGGANPGGTITFDLFAPADTACATPIFSSSVPVNGNGSYNSASFTTAQAGTYRWQARYSGDANNSPVGPTACTDPGGAVVVTKANTVLTNTASGPVSVGGQIHDTATLSGGFSPTGTISFSLYGPADQFCSGTPLATSTATVNGNGPYQSAPFTATTPGVYKWRSSYSGDANNLAVTVTGCLDPNAASTVNGGGPTLVTTASAAPAVGGQLSDTAVLSGATNPTGTITFRLYGPDDATCTGTVRSQSTRNVSGNGTYTSDAFTVTAPGTYRYVASYSGDATNAALATACGDPAETVVVTAGSTTTTTTGPTTTTSTSTTSTTVVPTSTTSSSTTSTTAASTTTSSTTTTTPASTTTSSTTSSTTSTTAPTATTSSSTTTTLAPTSTTSSSSTTTTVAPTSTGSSTTTTVAPTSTSTPTSSTTTSSTTTLATTTTSTTVAVATGTTVAPRTATVSVSPNPVAAGQNATVTGNGFPAGPAAITLFSTPAELSRLTVPASGSFVVVVNIPADTPAGVHRLVVTGAAGTVLAETTVTVNPLGLVQLVAGALANVRILSRTGTDVTGPGAVALGALFLGAVMVGLSRRRPLPEGTGEAGPYRRRRRHPWD